MVHSVEILVIHSINVQRIHAIDFEQGNLDTALGKTYSLSTHLRVNSCRSHKHNDARTIGLDELLAARNFLIYIKPHVLSEHRNINCILERSRLKVVVHIGLVVFKPVLEVQVIDIEIILLKPLVELISVTIGVKLIAHIGVYGFTKTLLATRGE